MPFRPCGEVTRRRTGDPVIYRLPTVGLRARKTAAEPAGLGGYGARFQHVQRGTAARVYVMRWFFTVPMLRLRCVR